MPIDHTQTNIDDPRLRTTENVISQHFVVVLPSQYTRDKLGKNNKIKTRGSVQHEFSRTAKRNSTILFESFAKSARV